MRSTRARLLRQDQLLVERDAVQELEGIVRSSWDTAGSGPARRVYRLTTSGRRLLDEWANELRRLQGATRVFLATYDGTPPAA